MSMIKNKNWLEVLMPFLVWLPKVTRADLKGDLGAAVVGAIVVLPQAVAFATIAGMPPEYGLYAGMVPAIIAALYGSSRHLVSGPTTAASVVLYSSLSAVADPGTPDYVMLALTLTFMVGFIELAMGLARLGALINFISHSVVIGFTAGAAMIIAAKQLKHAFGLDVDSSGHVHEILLEVTRHFGDINTAAVVITLATLAVAIIFKLWVPRVPYMIAAIIGGSLVALGIDQFWSTGGHVVPMVGALPASLPPLSAPQLTLDNIKHLAPAALAVSLFALTEAVSIGRSLAARGGYRLDGNQEFIGQGLSNIGGSFFSGYVATGSFNRSGINAEAGARTPLSAVFAAIILMAIVPFIAPLVTHLPKAAMAGLLFIVAWGIIDFREIKHTIMVSRPETSVLMVTFFSAVFLELEFAIFAGVLLSLALFLLKTSQPHISRIDDDEKTLHEVNGSQGTLSADSTYVAEIAGAIFFGSTNHIENILDTVRTDFPEKTHLIIVANGVSYIDLQGVDTLCREAEKRQALGGNLYIARAGKKLQKSLDRLGFSGVLYPE